jgi:predicted O-methyltransferase YrrM
LSFIHIGQVVETARLRRHGLTRHMRVFSHTSATERLALFSLSKILPLGARVLEIGSHVGSSALFLCAGLTHCDGTLICVDTWMNDTMPEGAKDTFGEFLANTKCYGGMIVPIRKYSNQLTAEDIGGLLDLALIDGDHSEKAVREDFSLLANWIRPGGYIAFHDLRTNFPGVHVVVGEALAGGEWQIVSLHDTLGVIRRIAQ